jgi:hypothetical protein
MLNFRQFTEALTSLNDEEKSIQAIKAGLNISEDFWENFISVSGNSDALAMLLQVPREVVTSWAGRIRKLIEKVKNQDDNSDAKKKILKTGHLNIGK